jgi:hypothetical protein
VHLVQPARRRRRAISLRQPFAILADAHVVATVRGQVEGCVDRR